MAGKTTLNKAGRGNVTVEFQGAAFLKAYMAEIEDGFRKETNTELRDASMDIAAKVVIPQLKRSARSSPMKIARAFADTAQVKRDRIVMVQIGGRLPALSGFKRGVGKKKAIARQQAGTGGMTASGRDATSAGYAASMAWGSEYGPWPWTDHNTYGQPRREPEGYWITKGITSALPAAAAQYTAACQRIMNKFGKYR